MIGSTTIVPVSCFKSPIGNRKSAMSRGASPGRATPLLDDWKVALIRRLNERGARTELAEWLEQHYGSTVDRWKVQISKVLNTPHVPDGEFVLAVDRWIRAQKPASTTKNRRRINLLIHK
jgi:hypothetical protein